MVSINDMKNEIRLADLFECAAERNYQMMRELANKTDSINEDRRCRASEKTLPKALSS